MPDHIPLDSDLMDEIDATMDKVRAEIKKDKPEEGGDSDEEDEWYDIPDSAFAVADASKYQQRQITRGPRAGQTGWFDTRSNKFMPENWKPTQRNSTQDMPSRPRTMSKGGESGGMRRGEFDYSQDEIQVIEDPDEIQVVEDPDELQVIEDPDELQVIEDPDEIQVIEEPEELQVTEEAPTFGDTLAGPHNAKNKSVIGALQQISEEEEVYAMVQVKVGRAIDSLQEQYADLGDLSEGVPPTDPASIQRYREYHNKLTPLLRALKQATDDDSKLQETKRKRVKEILSVDNPVKMSVTFPEGSESEEWAKNSQKALDFLHGIVSGDEFRRSISTYKFQRTAGSRAYYDGSTHMVDMGSSVDDATAAHEMAHGIEQVVDGVLESVQEFLKHRLGDEKPQSMAALFPGYGYGPEEMGAKDQFDKAFPDPSHAYYVGKTYAVDTGKGLRVTATEVISMGVEALYRDAPGFAKRDPEFCEFIVGILNGSLRK